MPLQKTGPTGSGIGDGAQFSQSLEPQDTKEEEKEFGDTPLKSPVQTTDIDEQPSSKGDSHQNDSQPVGEEVNGLFCLSVSIILLCSLCFHILW